MTRPLVFLMSALAAGIGFAAQPTPKPAPTAQADIAKPVAGTQAENARPAGSAQALGRLFFTPAERVQLDVARLQKKPTQIANAEPEPTAPPPPQTVSYGGIVKRSDGTSTLWINNRVVDGKDALSALSLKGKVRPDGAVTVQVPDTGTTVDVKVGQSVEVQSGKVAETRRRDPEAKPPAPDAKAPAGDAKPAAADAKPPAQAAGQPPTDAAEKKAEAAGSFGLKMDLGGRRLDHSENQRITRDSALK